MNLFNYYFDNSTSAPTISNSNYNFDYFQLKNELTITNYLPTVLIDIIISYIITNDSKDKITLFLVKDNNSMFSSIESTIHKILNSIVPPIILQTVQLHWNPDNYEELVYIIKQTLNLTHNHIFLKFCDQLELRFQNYELLEKLSKKIIQVNILEDRSLLNKLTFSNASIEEQHNSYLIRDTDAYIRTQDRGMVEWKLV